MRICMTTLHAQAGSTPALASRPLRWSLYFPYGCVVLLPTLVGPRADTR